MIPSIAPSYIHSGKLVAPRKPLAVGGRRLKWYDIGSPDRPVPDDIRAMARAFVADSDLDSLSDLGFVVLHRCGADFYFLLVCSWQGNNEIWESVYAKDRDDSGFRDWPRLGVHLPTFCVWEMGVVAHESAAWQRYLVSARDEAATETWLADQFAGAI